jgi:hypothetical protein
MKQFALLIVLLIVMAGCGPKPVTTETHHGCEPDLVMVEPGPKMLTVAWKATCDDLIAGYNIYVSDQPLDNYSDAALPSSIKPFNDAPFPGDTSPDDGIEYFEANGLEPGVKYYVTVRTVFPDRTQSKASAEISEGCGFTGEIILPVRYATENDGFSMVDGEYVKSKDLSNDLYYFNKDGIDYLNSPTRLDGFLRESHLKVLKVKGDYDQVRKKLLTTFAAPSEDKIEIRAGDWVHLRTADNGNAYIKVLGFDGDGDSRTIRLFVRFSSPPIDLTS